MEEVRKLIEDYWFVIGPLLLGLIANLRARYKDNQRAQDWLDQAEQRALDYGEEFQPGDIGPPPWRLPSRARPVKRYKAKMRGFGLHRKSDGTEYKNWVRLHPNPGFKIAGRHWSVAKARSSK